MIKNINRNEQKLKRTDKFNANETEKRSLKTLIPFAFKLGSLHKFFVYTVIPRFSWVLHSKSTRIEKTRGVVLW